MSHLFSCCTAFMWIFSCCTYFVLYTFRVLLVPCHTFFMLNSFHVVPFSCCIFLCVSLLSCCAFSRVASSCTLFMLHFLGIQASNFIKKRLHNRCFPVKFVKFLRAPIWRTSANDCFNKFSLKLCQCQSLTQFRSSLPEVFCKKGVIRNFPKFTVKHLCQSRGVVRGWQKEVKPPFKY